MLFLETQNTELWGKLGFSTLVPAVFNHADRPHVPRLALTTSAQRQYEIRWQVPRTNAFAQQQGAEADGQPVATAAAGSRAVQCGAACRRARSGT
jgi:hypothetical protein